jgi:hypothetical protein
MRLLPLLLFLLHAIIVAKPAIFVPNAFYPKYNANLNKIIKQENNNNNIK